LAVTVKDRLETAAFPRLGYFSSLAEAALVVMTALACSVMTFCYVLERWTP
jgi:hypothetical protein